MWVEFNSIWYRKPKLCLQRIWIIFFLGRWRWWWSRWWYARAFETSTTNRYVTNRHEQSGKFVKSIEKGQNSDDFCDRIRQSEPFRERRNYQSVANKFVECQHSSRKVHVILFIKLIFSSNWIVTMMGFYHFCVTDIWLTTIGRYSCLKMEAKHGRPRISLFNRNDVKAYQWKIKFIQAKEIPIMQEMNFRPDRWSVDILNGIFFLILNKDFHLLRFFAS